MVGPGTRGIVQTRARNQERLTTMAMRVALALLICSLANAASAAVPSVGPGHEGVRLELIADGFGVLSNGAAPGGERDLVYLLEQHEGRVVLVENGSVAGRRCSSLPDS